VHLKKKTCFNNPVQIEQLIRKGQEAKEFAYCPYSNFPVGAALLTLDGKIFFRMQHRKCFLPSWLLCRMHCHSQGHLGRTQRVLGHCCYQQRGG
uniref:CMP/dCMP-type deaminase domain-containing protein n=1 Tax=Vombatus ursinus TaxID=29139 RepID=A0A4X2K4A4_VOMUR